MRTLKPGLALFMLMGLLSACGQSGGLYLPPPANTQVNAS